MPQVKPPLEHDDGFDLPDFGDDFLALLRQMYPDLDGLPTGWPRYRAGGSPRNWDVSGDGHLAVGMGFVQIGFKQIDVVPAGVFGSFSLGFRQAFSGRPLVFCTLYSTDPNNIRVTIRAQGNRADADYYWWASANIDMFKFQYIAFGPGGGTG